MPLSQLLADEVQDENVNEISEKALDTWIWALNIECYN